jgi:type IV pilus assembly protein PilV
MYINAQLRKSQGVQQGMTLLEVLVAILILSFGLLGMVGLLVNGLKITSSSHYRTVAAQQLSSMADVINANPYVVPLYYAPPASNSVANKDCFTGGLACLDSSGALPQTDYALWKNNLAALLPNGAGVVCLDVDPSDGDSTDFECDGSGRLTVKICWNERARVAVSGGGVAGTGTATDTCLSAQL